MDGYIILQGMGIYHLARDGYIILQWEGISSCNGRVYHLTREGHAQRRQYTILHSLLCHLTCAEYLALSCIRYPPHIGWYTTSWNVTYLSLVNWHIAYQLRLIQNHSLNISMRSSSANYRRYQDSLPMKIISKSLKNDFFWISLLLFDKLRKQCSYINSLLNDIPFKYWPQVIYQPFVKYPVW